MNVSLDIGNLAVGIGTACAAIVALLVGLQGARSPNTIWLKESRKNWIENLPDHLAKFEAVSRQMDMKGTMLANRIKSQLPADDLRSEYRALMSEFDYNDSYVRLMLNPQEDWHMTLLARMDRIRTTLNSAESISSHLLAYQTASRQVLKGEWNRIKT